VALDVPVAVLLDDALAVLDPLTPAAVEDPEFDPPVV